MVDLSSLPPGHQAMSSALAPLGRMQRFVLALYTTLGLASATAAMAVVAACVAHQHSVATSRACLLVVVALGATTALVATTTSCLRATQTSRRPKSAKQLTKLAAEAENLSPALGTQASSAAHFVNSKTAGGLALVHIDKTSLCLEHLPLPSLYFARHRARLMGLGGLVGILALVAGLRLGLSERAQKVWAGIAYNVPVYLTAQEPVVLDVGATVAWPKYTARKKTVFPSGIKNIRALRGSTVSFVGKTKKIPQHAGLLCQPPKDSGATACGIHIEDDGTLRWDFLADEALEFGAWVDLGDGVRLVDPQRFSLQVHEDQTPEVKIISPLPPTALTANQNLVIRWHATDDFGCRAADAILLNAQGENITVKSSFVTQASTDPLGPQHCSGIVTFDAKTLDLLADETLSFVVQVDDACPQPRPHWGTSQTHAVTRMSAEAHHRLLLAQQRDVFNLLVDWLAAEYEAPKPPQPDRALGHAIDSAHKATSALCHALDADVYAQPAEQEAWRHVAEHTRLSAAKKDRLDPVGWKDSRIKTLAADILYLDDLLALAGNRIAQTSTHRLREAQKAIKTLISDLGHGHDQQLLPEIQSRLGVFRQRLQEVLDRAASAKPTYAPEDLNIDAHDQQAAQATLKRIEAALKAEDPQAIAEELEHLEKMVDRLEKGLEDATSTQDSPRYRKARQELEQVAHAIEETAAKQRTVALRINQMAQQEVQQATGADNTAMWQRAEQLRAQIAPAVVRLEKFSEATVFAGRELEHISYQSHELKSPIELRQFKIAQEQSSQILATGQRAGKSFRALSFVRQAEAPDAYHSLLALLQELKKCFDKPSSNMGHPTQGGWHQKMSDEQKQLSDKLAMSAQKLQELGEAMPLLGEAEEAWLQKSQQSMQASQSALRERRTQRAGESAQQAADALDKMQQAIKKPQSKGGLPEPLGIPNQPASPRPSQNPTESVALPEQQPDPQAQFREDVQRAARVPAPPRYQKSVRDYHDELIR